MSELAAKLRRLHANGHPSGLERRTAENLARALQKGTPLGAAATQAGLDPRWARMIAVSGVTDVPRALTALLTIAGDTTAHSETLRSAAIYPLTVAFSITAAGFAIFGAAAPALAMLPLGAPPTPATPLLVAPAVACGLLVVLSLLVLGRVRIPFLAHGWRRIEGYAFLASVRALADAPLPTAIRAAALMCSGAGRRRAEGMARALESGAPFSDTPLDPFEAGMLQAAARMGTVPETLVALTDARLRALEREVPDEAMRIQSTALVLAGAAILLTGAAFYRTYYNAVAGG